MVVGAVTIGNVAIAAGGRGSDFGAEKDDAPEDVRGYDVATGKLTSGKLLWETELSAGTTGGPMTYMFKGKQYVVVPVGDKDRAAEWIALALP